MQRGAGQIHGESEQLPASNARKREAFTVGFQEPDPTSLEGLTDRQFRFATLRFQGLDGIAAYRAAYNCEGAAYHTIASCSSRLSSNPFVIAKIVDLRDQVTRQSTLSAGLNRDFVLNGLMGLAVSSDKDSVRLGALQTLGKTVGIDLFRETVVHETRTRTVEDVEAELKSKLDTLRAGLTIEGKAERLEPGTSPPIGAKDRRRKPASK